MCHRRSTMFSVKGFGIASAIDERNGIRRRFPFTTVNDAQELKSISVNSDHADHESTEIGFILKV